MAIVNKSKTDLVVSNIRESNISDYINIMSDEELLSILLNRPTTGEKKEQFLKNLIQDDEIKDLALNAVSDVLQSITTEATTISEMLEMLYLKYYEKAPEVLTALSSFIKIVHAKDYNVATVNNDTIKLQEIPFVIDYEMPEKKDNNLYEHHSTYGILSNDIVEEFYAEEDQSGFSGDLNTMQNIIDRELTSSKGCRIYNVDTILNEKSNKTSGEDDTENYVNNITQGKIDQTKVNPSLAYVLVDSADLRIGTRNSIELATFFNTLSTIELSKCQPFFNAVFILPGEVKNSSNKVFKTASITQFLDGTPLAEAFTTDTYQQLNASFVRAQKTREGSVDQQAVNTNLASFTMPQTVNRFDEHFVGHNESFDLNAGKIFNRATSIHDYTRPFLTIKSFDIDVAPTQGLMSFKSGKLSMVLHDRTRMTDIAPFIKPDLFGSFGAEIAIEYGWSHIDAGGKINYLGDFLNNSRVVEKYIITNSSFNMDKNGQVNIDLSIAMRGPIDLKTVLLKSDPPKEIKKQSAIAAVNTFTEELNKIGGTGNNKAFSINTRLIQRTISNEISQIQGDDGLAVSKSSASLSTIKALKKKYNRLGGKSGFIKRINSVSIKDDDPANKIEEIFNDYFISIDNDTILQNHFTFSNSKKRTTKTTVKSKKNTSTQASEQNDSSVETSKQAANQSKNTIDKVAVKEKVVLSEAQLTKIKQTINEYYPKVMSRVGNIISAGSHYNSQKTKIINKIIGGLDKIDPFYNKEWLKQYRRIISEDDITQGINISGLGNGKTTKGSSYVSLGAFITGLVGSHLTCTGKFDEIQIISYTANEHCGLMSNLNVSSFLIPRDELDQFLEDLFQNGTSMTIESLISQVIQRFISTRMQICYGLKDYYTRDAAKNTVVIKKYRNNSKKLQTVIDRRLIKIYRMLAKDETSEQNIEDTVITSEGVKFVMPKVKFTFDTITSKKSAFSRTICRISIFDENDNPFGSIHSIMKKIYDEEGVVNISAQLNKNRANYKATGVGKVDKKSAKKGKNKKRSKRYTKQQKLTKERFYKKQYQIIQNLINQGKLVHVGNGNFEIIDKFQIDTIKNSIKNIMPSITYGTQNSAVIDASVTTVNEAKLNTIYLTRSDRNNVGKQLKSNVYFQKDLPLRVLPSQANVTVFGCPFVNFAQYMFLDFETGTTVDNAYAITGIKHSLSPGKFTTSLTLSYGDVYGKYENSSSSIARAIDEITENNIGLNKRKQDPNISNIYKIGNQNITTRSPFNVKNIKEAGYFDNNILNDISSKYKVLVKEIYFYPFNRDVIHLKTKNINNNIELKINHFVDIEKTMKYNQVETKFNLLKFKDFRKKMSNLSTISKLYDNFKKNLESNLNNVNEIIYKILKKDFSNLLVEEDFYLSNIIKEEKFNEFAKIMFNLSLSLDISYSYNLNLNKTKILENFAFQIENSFQSSFKVEINDIRNIDTSNKEILIRCLTGEYNEFDFFEPGFINMINVLDPSTKISDFRAIKNNEPMINQNYANLFFKNPDNVQINILKERQEFKKVKVGNTTKKEAVLDKNGNPALLPSAIEFNISGKKVLVRFKDFNLNEIYS